MLPESRRVLEELEVRYCLLPLSSRLDRFEKIEVNARVKDCESALGALRRRQEFATFDPDQADSYSLTSLNDLAGVRVLAFPRTRWREANDVLRSYLPFSSWASDPVSSGDGRAEPLAFKYHGLCPRNTKLVRAELQIVPMLTGLFWEVEHAAIYKPSPQLKGVLASLEMQQPILDVYRALGVFEAEFERLVRTAPIDKL